MTRTHRKPRKHLTGRLETLAEDHAGSRREAEHTPVWTELQERLGNERVQTLAARGPVDELELYVTDLLALNTEQGADFGPLLPWHASPAWMRLVRPWYRVLWAEYRRAEMDPSESDLAEPGRAEEGPASPPASAEPSPGPTGAGSVESGPAAVSDGTSAPLPGLPSAFETGPGALPTASPAAEGAGMEPVARAAEAPDLQDPEEMASWFDRLGPRSGTGRAPTDREIAFLEQVHGRHLPPFRLHEGSGAREAAEAVQARAFTVGDEIWMGESVDLDDPAGADLLAHETTHVLQHAAGREAGQKGPVSEPGEPLEVEAEARGRKARRMHREGAGPWGPERDQAEDPRARAVLDWIRDRLPESAPEAPDALVRQGLLRVLERRATDRLQALERLAQAVAPMATRQEQATLRQDLDALRVAIHGAGDDPVGLRALLDIGGAPTAGELAREQADFAPYPDFGARLAGALRGLVSDDRVATLEEQLLQGAPGVDAEHAEPDARTGQMVDDLASAFRLPAGSVEVHTDADTRHRLRHRGVRGLEEHGDILLDPTAYEPGTADGRELVAHEVAHAAQEQAPSGARTAPDSLAAEVDAARVGEQFARGHAPEAPSFAMPAGHEAAEGELGGDLDGLLQSYLGPLEASTESMTPAGETPSDNADPNATEDRERKVERYEDGVDGIADQIGDLDAFEDLRDAIDDEEDTAGPLGRVRGSEPFGELCRMWQGAKEGEADSSRMMSIFDAEFQDRGFWGNTEQAFDMVRDAAKADAQPEPEASAARQDLSEAEENTEPEQSEVESTEESTEGGETAAEGLEAESISPELQARLGDSVPDQAPEISSFEEMSAISDDQLDAITEQLDHQVSLGEQHGSMGWDRAGQIFEAFGENFGGGFVQSFVDQGIDALVWDNLGWVADQGLKLATRGRLGTPMIGPLIGLVRNPPWTAEAWGLGEDSKWESGLEHFSDISETWSHMEDAEGIDKVGVFCAAAADLLEGIRDIVDMLATISGTLSALCYVVGGILILVGLALCWIPGMATLISVGGWLTRAGSILGRVSSVLGFIALALSALAAVFRTAAAFMVPAEMYAEQLEGVGDAAGEFGNKAGGKAADTLADGVGDRTRRRIEGRVDANIARRQSGADASSDTDTVRDLNEESSQRVEDANEELRRLEDQAGQDGNGTRNPDEESSDRPRDTDEESDTRNRPDDDTRTRARRVLDTCLAPFKRRVDEIVSIKNDIGRAVTDARNFSQEGLPPAVRRELDSRIDEARTRIEEANELLRDRDGDMDSDQAHEVNQSLSYARTKLLEIRRFFDEQANRDYDARRDVESFEDLTLRRRGDEHERLQDEITRVDGEVDVTRRRIEDAEQRIRDEEAAREEADRRADELADTEEIRDHRRQYEEQEAERRARLQGENQNHLDEMDRLNTLALDLEQQARDAQEANRLRSDMESLEPDARTAREQADAHLQDIRGFENTRVRMEIDDGEGGTRLTHRRLISADEDGITVTNGRNDTQHFRYDEIKYPVALRELAGSYQEQRTRADDLDAQVQDLEDRANRLSQPDVDPQQLLDQARVHRDQATSVRQQYEDNETAARTSSPDPEGDALMEPSRRAREEARNHATSAEGARGDLERLQAELDGLQESRRVLEGQLDELTPNEEQERRMQGVEKHIEMAREGSSGNATGGVGSAYKDPAEEFLRWTGVVDWMLGAVGDAQLDSAHFQQQVSGGNQTVGLAVEGMAETVLGIERETGQELEDIGERQARLEAVLEHEPPVEDLEAMMDRRARAMEAFDQYQVAHATALRAYVAEQTVDELSQGTLALAESGEPIRTASQSMSGPLEQSRSDEQERASVLSGGDPTVQQTEGGMAGLVAQLITHLGDHSDEMDDQPDPGNADAGNQMEEGEGQAREEAEGRTREGTEASDQQRAFLDQAVTVRAAQEESVCQSIDTLHDKYDHEQAILDEIKRQKAEALVERDRHADTVQEHAQGFVDDFQSMDTWREEYESLRDELGSSP